MWDRERGEHGHRITPKVRLVLASFKSAKLTYQIQKWRCFSMNYDLRANGSIRARKFSSPRN